MAEEWMLVSVSWEHAYGACQPAAAELLRVVATLDLAVVSSPAVGVAAGLTPTETTEALAELGQEGWVKPAQGGAGDAVAARARTWLVANAAALVDPPRAAAIVRGFVEYHAAAVDLGRHDPAEVDAWLARHHPEVLAAIRACDRDGLRRLGMRLALAVLPSAKAPWWAELAEAGEALAIADRDPELLADLLHHSAATFAGHGDRLRAEEQWVRALAIIRRPDHLEPGNRDLGIAVLSGLGALYREWGRLGQALDADLGLVDLRLAEGDPLGIAEAMTTVAATMHAAGRASTAADYLAQADEAITAILGADDSLEVLALHTQILIRWGLALWDHGQHTAARRPWSRALAMLIDVDDDAAEHVRALLATAPDDALPIGYPGLSNTSSSSSGGKG